MRTTPQAGETATETEHKRKQSAGDRENKRSQTPKKKTTGVQIRLKAPKKKTTGAKEKRRKADHWIKEIREDRQDHLEQKRSFKKKKEGKAMKMQSKMRAAMMYGPSDIRIEQMLKAIIRLGPKPGDARRIAALHDPDAVYAAINAIG